MNIIPPEQVRDKLELSADDVNEAVTFWLKERHGLQLHGSLTIITTVGNGHRAVGELKLPNESAQPVI